MVDNLDRRTFSLGALMAITAACGTGSKQGRAQSAASNFWTLWRDRFVSAEGRVVDNGNGGVSHSEGQSYGLILAYQANDRDTFERIARWTRDNLSRPDMALHAWRYDPRQPVPVSDPNNATDGDLVIAWALALAGKRWSVQEWLDRSAQIRKAIKAHCVISRYGHSLLLPGIVSFVEAKQVTLNLSYFAWPALDYFARIDGKGEWGAVISSAEQITKLAQFGPHRLPADWVVITGPKDVAPAPDKQPRFGFDAIRVPLYAIAGGRTALVEPIAQWWSGCIAQPRPIPAWVDVVTGEEANFALSSGGQSVVARLLKMPVPAVLDTDYYSASLQMLSTL